MAGTELHLSNIGIDAGWQTEIVYKFCREHDAKNILLPCMGVPVPAGKKLYTSKSKGSTKGSEWIYAAVQSAARPVRLLRANANHWKTFAFTRLRMPLGGDGAITFFGKKSNHKTFFNHLTAEYKTVLTVDEVNYDRWDNKPNRANHFFDTVYGCCVLGNYLGIDTFGKADTSRVRVRKRKRITGQGSFDA